MKTENKLVVLSLIMGKLGEISDEGRYYNKLDTLYTNIMGMLGEKDQNLEELLEEGGGIPLRS